VSQRARVRFEGEKQRPGTVGIRSGVYSHGSETGQRELNSDPYPCPRVTRPVPATGTGYPWSSLLPQVMRLHLLRLVLIAFSLLLSCHGAREAVKPLGALSIARAGEMMVKSKEGK
jgi:hypothetical protein